MKLPLVGARARPRRLCEPPGEHLYGSEADALRALPGADTLAVARWRRRPERGDGALRGAPRDGAHASKTCWRGVAALLFLDAAQAAELVEPVAALLSDELQRDVSKAERSAFKKLALQYRTLPD